MQFNKHLLSIHYFNRSDLVLSGISRNWISTDKSHSLTPSSYLSRSLTLIQFQPSFNSFRTTNLLIPPSHRSSKSGFFFVVFAWLEVHGQKSNDPLAPLMSLCLLSKIITLAESNSSLIANRIWKKTLSHTDCYHFKSMITNLKCSLNTSQRSCYTFLAHWLSASGGYFMFSFVSRSPTPPLPSSWLLIVLHWEN